MCGVSNSKGDSVMRALKVSLRSLATIIVFLFVSIINSSDVAAVAKVKAGGKHKMCLIVKTATVTLTSKVGFAKSITGKVKAFAKAGSEIGKDPPSGLRKGDKVTIKTYPPPPNHLGWSGTSATVCADTVAHSPPQGTWKAKAEAYVKMSGNPVNKQKEIGSETKHWVPSADITLHYNLYAAVESGHRAEAKVDYKDPMVLYVASADTFGIALLLESGLHFQGIASCSLEAASDFPDLDGLVYRLVIQAFDDSLDVEFWSNPALGLSDPYIEDLIGGAFTLDPDSAIYVLSSDLEVFQCSFIVPEGIDSIGCEWGGSAFVMASAGAGAIPTLTEWGLIIFAVVLIGFITWVFLRRRKAVLSYQ